MQALELAAFDGRAVVASLWHATPALKRLLTSVLASTKPLANALPTIKTTFCQLNPMLRYMGPYTNDILQSAFHLGSASNSYDAIGHLVRLVPLLSEDSLSGTPPAVLNASRVLLQSGLFLPQKTLSDDPFMAPGQIAKVYSTGSTPSGPVSLAATGYKYPRIHADC